MSWLLRISPRCWQRIWPRSSRTTLPIWREPERSWAPWRRVWRDCGLPMIWLLLLVFILMKDTYGGIYENPYKGTYEDICVYEGMKRRLWGYEKTVVCRWFGSCYWCLYKYVMKDEYGGIYESQYKGTYKDICEGTYEGIYEGMKRLCSADDLALATVIYIYRAWRIHMGVYMGVYMRVNTRAPMRIYVWGHTSYVYLIHAHPHAHAHAYEYARAHTRAHTHNSSRVHIVSVCEL